MNGQKSRSGASTQLKTGGQTKFYMGLPKAKGFKRLRKNYISLNAKHLNSLYKDGENVTDKNLREKLKITSSNRIIKIYSLPELKIKLNFESSIKLSKSPKDA